MANCLLRGSQEVGSECLAEGPADLTRTAKIADDIHDTRPPPRSSEADLNCPLWPLSSPLIQELQKAGR